MSTMKAALFDGEGVMRLTALPKPTPGPLDALVRVRAVGICGSDLLMNADKTEPDDLPTGHEVAGEIVEVGEGVDPARVGERVAVETIGHGRSCGDCWFCRQGQFIQCQHKDDAHGGGFAEYILRRAAGCYPLGDALSWEEGALVEPLAVSVHGVRRGDLKGGETVAVLGSGNIGLTAIAAARALGAGRVFATARHQQQAAMAKRLGADDALPPDGPAFWEALADATDGRGADLTIETVGGKSEATAVQSIEVTRRQGRIAIVGGFRRPITVDWLPPMLKEQTIAFSSCYNVMDGRHDYELAIEMMARGQADLGQMVTHRYSLDEIQRGFETAYDKSTGSIKVQIHS